MKNQIPNINILLKQCLEKNEKAQLTIYNWYYKAMFNTAFRIVGNHEWAEDIMQECFLKAFTKLESFSTTVTFGSWLKKIVVNHSINELKKSNKYQIEDLSDNLDIQDYNKDIIKYDELKVQKVLIKLQQLKSNYRIILTLFFIEGYDLEEIQGILEISYENCRTMMSRAKESLRKKMMES